jgi:6-pyruvoyltetrahydropterin/6-carboxytetrahydropterin synthase
LLQVTRRLCKELNEYFICPTLSDVLTITEEGDSVHITAEDGARFTFPRVSPKKARTPTHISFAQSDRIRLVPQSDCAMLPIMHSTAEELAH